jgi:hypothetical protein
MEHVDISLVRFARLSIGTVPVSVSKMEELLYLYRYQTTKETYRTFTETFGRVNFL